MEALTQFMMTYVFAADAWQGDLVGFMIFITVASITPGPNNSLLMNSGLRFGISRSVPHAMGIIFGFTTLFLMIGVFIAFLSEEIITVLRWVSSAILLYVAYKIATAPLVFDQEDSGSESAKPWSFWQSTAFQAVNPKALMMAFAAQTAYQIKPIAGVVLVALACTVCFIWLFAGAALRHLIKDNPLAARITFILMGLGLIATLFL